MPAILPPHLAMPMALLPPGILPVLFLLLLTGLRTPPGMLTNVLLSLLPVDSALVVVLATEARRGPVASGMPTLASVLLAAEHGSFGVGRRGLEARVRRVAALEQLLAGPAPAAGAPEAPYQAGEGHPGPDEDEDYNDAGDHQGIWCVRARKLGTCCCLRWKRWRVERRSDQGRG